MRKILFILGLITLASCEPETIIETEYIDRIKEVDKIVEVIKEVEVVVTETDTVYVDRVQVQEVIVTEVDTVYVEIPVTEIVTITETEVITEIETVYVDVVKVDTIHVHHNWKAISFFVSDYSNPDPTTAANFPNCGNYELKQQRAWVDTEQPNEVFLGGWYPGDINKEPNHYRWHRINILNEDDQWEEYVGQYYSVTHQFILKPRSDYPYRKVFCNGETQGYINGYFKRVADDHHESGEDYLKIENGTIVERYTWTFGGTPITIKKDDLTAWNDSDFTDWDGDILKFTFPNLLKNTFEKVDNIHSDFTQ